jgi:CMP/dCMP kinase
MVAVAISGMPGCGSTTAGRLLAKKLRMDFFSSGEYFKSLAEGKTKGALKFFASEKGSSKNLHESIDQMQIEKAKKGNIVCEGKLAIHFLKNIVDHKIWFKASQYVRAERYSRRDDIEFKEALSIVKEKDSLERKIFLEIYGFDTFNQEKDADIIIDTSHKNPDEIVQEIMVFIKNK